VGGRFAEGGHARRLQKESGMTSFDSDEEFLNAVRGLIYRLCDERQLRPLGLLLPGYLAFNGTTNGWLELRVGLVNLRDHLGSESFVPLDWDVLNDLIHAADAALQNSD
jgi:hypothetical protein